MPPRRSHHGHWVVLRCASRRTPTAASRQKGGSRSVSSLVLLVDWVPLPSSWTQQNFAEDLLTGNVLLHSCENSQNAIHNTFCRHRDFGSVRTLQHLFSYPQMSTVSAGFPQSPYQYLLYSVYCGLKDNSYL